MAISRRHLLQNGAVAALAPALGRFAVIDTASAQSSAEPAWRHALSLFGDVKYPADFKRFDYVNPDAPKGGVARLISLGTFDNFNVAVAGIKGNIAAADGRQVGVEQVCRRQAISVRTARHWLAVLVSVVLGQASRAC